MHLTQTMQQISIEMENLSSDSEDDHLLNDALKRIRAALDDTSDNKQSTENIQKKSKKEHQPIIDLDLETDEDIKDERRYKTWSHRLSICIIICFVCTIFIAILIIILIVILMVISKENIVPIDLTHATAQLS